MISLDIVKYHACYSDRYTNVIVSLREMTVSLLDYHHSMNYRDGTFFALYTQYSCKPFFTLTMNFLSK